MSSIEVKSSEIPSQSIKVPGSKYLANRYIAIAAFANGKTQLNNLPINQDITAALRAVEALGATINFIDKSSVVIDGINSRVSDELIKIDCHDSGTLSRFVTALAANMKSPVLIDASEQMCQRPMQEIYDALIQLGVSVESKGKQGHLPLLIQGPIKGGECILDASRSSQFLSALLIASIQSEDETRIELATELVSESYIELTLNAIEKFTDRREKIIERTSKNKFVINSKYDLKPAHINVAGDVVSCSYFMAAALIGKTDVTIKDYDFESKQGEAQFPSVLEKMGAEIKRMNKDLLISHRKPLTAIEVDMGNMPDAVPTLAAICCFIDGITTITNIAHLAYKESNRIVDLCQQLQKLGANCEYGEDYIKIDGSALLTASRVSSCHDHRLAMSLALIGIQVPGIVIEGANAVEKSFPTYWDMLEQIGIELAKR